ncbi:MAG: hypothetical protein ABI718_13865 [Acidobacteriota bacterium]
MFRHVNIVGAITVPVAKQRLVELLWDIGRIPEFDLKADRVEVTPKSETTGSYRVWGRFARIPWSRDFEYFLNADGFYLREANPSGPEPAIHGGFMVQEVGPEECTLIHYEQYWFARRLEPLRPFLVAYLNWSVRVELKKIRRAATETGS